MRLSELNPGDYIKFKDYYSGESVIGILDCNKNEEYHVYINTDDTHRRWFKIFADEIIARIKYTEETIEENEN